jgi:hypothetical protein
MPSLLGTTVAANYLKTKPTTQMGTRILRFLEITVNNEGSHDVDLTKQTGATGAFTDSNSYYSAAVRALQEVAEVYAIYEPSATIFLALVSDTTINDSNLNTNVPGGYGDVAAYIAASINGVDAIDAVTPITGYDGTVTVKAGTIVGATITWA